MIFFHLLKKLCDFKDTDSGQKIRIGPAHFELSPPETVFTPKQSHNEECA